MSTFKEIDGITFKKVGSSWVKATSTEVASNAAGAIGGGLLLFIFLPFCGVNFIAERLFGTRTKSTVTGNYYYETDFGAGGALLIFLLSFVAACWMVMTLVNWEKSSFITKVFFVLFTLLCFVGCNS